MLHDAEVVQGESMLRSLRNAKGLATTTLFRNIWVLEHKALIQLVLQPIHLAPNNVQKRLVIDQNLNTVLLYLLVEHGRLIHVLQVISESGTPLRPCTNPYKLWFGLVEQLPQVRHRSRRELYGSFARAKVVSARSEGLRGRRGLRFLRFPFWYADTRAIVHRRGIPLLGCGLWRWGVVDLGSTARY